MRIYSDEIYSLQNLLSKTQEGPGRTVKKEQEEISPNHVQRLNLISVQYQIRPLDLRSIRRACLHVSLARCPSFQRHFLFWSFLHNLQAGKDMCRFGKSIIKQHCDIIVMHYLIY